MPANQIGGDAEQSRTWVPPTAVEGVIPLDGDVKDVGSDISCRTIPEAASSKPMHIGCVPIEQNRDCGRRSFCLLVAAHHPFFAAERLQFTTKELCHTP